MTLGSVDGARQTLHRKLPNFDILQKARIQLNSVKLKQVMQRIKLFEIPTSDKKIPA